MYNPMDMMHLPHEIASRLSLLLVSALGTSRLAAPRDQILPPAVWLTDAPPAAALGGHALPLHLVADDGNHAVFDRPAQPIGTVSSTGAYKVRLEDGEIVRDGAIYRIAPVD